MILWVLLALAVIVVGYIRLAPSDPAVWHQPPAVGGDKDFKAGVSRLVPAGPDGLARLNEIALATPRTKVLAGSVEDGMITYVSRSAVMGFPDYTTVRQVGADLQIHARLRFGRSDLGVNKARVERWLQALKAR